MRFVALFEPSTSQVGDLAALAPENPFVTEAYAEFRRVCGDRVWAFSLNDESPVSGCLAFERSGRLNRALEVTSLPQLPEPETFWRGLLEFCCQRRISQLDVESFASRAAAIPTLPHESSRRERVEYVLDLSPSRPPSLSSNNRRSLNRARANALSLRRTTDISSSAVHEGLMRASMTRRAVRGEAVDAVDGDTTTRRLLSSGAGELFQAVDTNGQVMSSVLVLRSQRGGYYQSAGTSPAGMECGASPFLISSIAAALTDDGATVFNLGGAGPDNPGLQRFKSGFGAREVPLQAANGCPSGAWRVSLANRARQLGARASAFVARSHTR